MHRARLLVIIVTALSAGLSGCQTVDEQPATGSVHMPVTGATASAIAGDMANRYSEQVGSAGSKILTFKGDASDYSRALHAAFKSAGYTLIADGKLAKDQKAVELSWSIDTIDGQILATVATSALSLSRAYFATSAGARAFSPLSVLKRN